MTYSNPVTGVTDCFVIFASFCASIATPLQARVGGHGRLFSGRMVDAINGAGHVVANQQ